MTRSKIKPSDDQDSVEKQNASQYPKFYYAKHMIGGLCGYDDEVLLIDADAMKRMIPTMDGKPVYNEAHDPRTPEERLQDIKESPCGYVTETFFNELDSWVWSKMMIIDDVAHENIASGEYAVSNAYIPTEYTEGGSYVNMPYDRRVLDGHFTHIAIVKNPRYEEAKILTPEQFRAYQDEKRLQAVELRNSKPEETKGLVMKFFKTKKEEVSQVDLDTSVEFKNSKGEPVAMTIKEMVNAVANADEQKIQVGDQEMTVTELVNAYQKMNSEKEEDESEDEKENESEDDDKEDEKENEDDDKDEKAEKENAKAKADHFKEMKNAHKGGSFKPVPVDTTSNRLQRGVSLYGSKA